MVEITDQTEGSLSVDAGFRAEGPELIDYDPDLPEPTDDDVRLTPAYGAKDTWELPGFGEPGSRCGEPAPVGVCENGHTDWGEHKCGNRSCPDCYGLWSRDAAIRGATRVQSFRHTQPDDWHRQLVHSVVSPEAGVINTAREYWNGYSDAAELAEEKGMRGFAVIGHPWRVTAEGKKLYREHGGAGSELGMWVWLRKHLDEAELMELIEWSPHYHIIGLASEDMEPASDDDEQTYKFIRSLSRYGGVEDRDSHEDVFGLFRYLLSHTGYQSGSTKQVTRWYGDLANSVFVDDATEEWQIQKPLDAEERIAEILKELASGEDRDGEGVDDEREQCSCEGCNAAVIPVEEIDAYLREYDPPDDVATVMQAVMDWRHSDVRQLLPPGIGRPETLEEAKEALSILVEDRERY